MALSTKALIRATARPTLTWSSNGMRRSWNGCEVGLQMNIQHGKDNAAVVVVVVDESSEWFDDEGESVSIDFGGDNDEVVSSMIFKSKSFA